MTDTTQPTPAAEDALSSESSMHLSKYERRALRDKMADKSPFAEPQYPDGPFIVDDVLTDDGKKLIMLSVGSGNLQDFVAHQLGLKPRAFAKKIKSSGEFADTWATANAAIDSTMLRLVVWRAQVLKDPEALKFWLRIRGFSEKTAPTTTVNIDNNVAVAGMGNLFTLPVGLSPELEAQVKAELADAGKFTLPGPMSDAAYAAKLKIDGVFDARSDEAKKRHAELFALAPPMSCDDPVDVQPTAVNPDE